MVGSSAQTIGIFQGQSVKRCSESEDTGSDVKISQRRENRKGQNQKEVSESKESRRVVMHHSLPMLSTQTLMFESTVAPVAQRSPILARPGTWKTWR
eukprot:symbB.v1.2.039101.t1/scaffold6350.1/size18817/2